VDEDQFWKLYEKLPQHQQPVALLAYETGARKKELLRLKWNQIDLKTRIVRLNRGETKNKDGRMFSYSDQMAEWFKVLPRVSEYVFTHRQKPLRSIRSGWDKAVEAVSGQVKTKPRRSKLPRVRSFTIFVGRP
jgi:integrase